MNKDLTYILNGQIPRAYGEMPVSLGNYKRLAPSEDSDKYVRMAGGQKYFGSAVKYIPGNEKIPTRPSEANFGRKSQIQQ